MLTPAERFAQPWTLPCGLVMPHRIAMAPLTNTQSHPDGTLSDDEYRWLVRRAEGGFRFVSTCAAFVSEEGHAWRGQLGIAHDDHLPGLTRLAQGLRDAGAVSVVQLHHAGAKATLAPVKLSTADADGVRGATADDLARVQADYVAAAQRAEAAGFDGVEIHGANGYLFTQFLAPMDNPRTDAWGGPLENRARLLLDTLRAVRAAVRPGFVVGVRISPVDGFAQRGLVLADACTLVGWLAEAGADFVHLSLSDAAGPAAIDPDGPPVAQAIRQALPATVPVFAAGGLRTPEDAVRAMDAGVDVPVLGRASIVFPDWPVEAVKPGFAWMEPPWDPDHLRGVAVGEAFVTYLMKFPGLLIGGAAPRG